MATKSDQNRRGESGSRTPARPAAGGQRSRTPFARLQQLVRDTATEIKKVQWPDQETTRNLTILVIVMSAVLGVALGLVDYGFRALWDWIPA